MFSEKISDYRDYYFVGIGGVSMSALARRLHEKGIPVRGSDAADSPRVRALIAEGIPVSIGTDEEIAAQAVVYTGAAEKDHPQLAAARRAGKRLISRAKFLGMTAEEYPHVISVAGCHGKTSCTAMLAHIFRQNDRKFTCHIGGEDAEFGNFACFGDEYFITEACEYRKSLLSLPSECAVILNIDRDHMDCYRNEKELCETFGRFAAAAKTAIVNADDPRACSLSHATAFGLSNGDYRALDLREEEERYSFTAEERGIPLVRIRLALAGRVQVLNALASFAAARRYGFTAEEIRAGLERFTGVGRRFEQIGTVCGMQAISDYAHHPREIAETLATARRLCRGRLRVVFQPHTYSRTKDLMEDFVSVLSDCEDLLICRTYAAREKFDADGSACALAARLPQAGYVSSAAQIKARLSDAPKKDDVILALGAGDIDRMMREILD